MKVYVLYTYYQANLTYAAATIQSPGWNLIAVFKSLEDIKAYTEKFHINEYFIKESFIYEPKK